MNQDNGSFKLIDFPAQSRSLEPRAGHDRFKHDRIHGWLDLALTAETPVHIAAGFVALGAEVGEPSVPMIRPMVQTAGGKLVIQGSSLKGCIRSIYEVITNSRLGTMPNKPLRTPRGFEPMKGTELCAAGRVFGAMSYQGLVSFTDAVCDRKPEVGFLRPMHSPDSEQYGNHNKIARGRKFYYQTCRVAEGNKRAVTIQRAPVGSIFTTRLIFKNLALAELGVLLIALGQDQGYQIALKLGAGKNQGMGTMTVKVTNLEVIDPRDRYLSYQAETTSPELISEAIAQAHSTLIEKSQLDALLEILRYPTNREPWEEL